MAFEKTLVVIAIILLETLASQATSRELSKAYLAEKHDQWMAEHGRVYPNSTEKERRFAIFKKNVEFVEDFNNEGNKTYRLGINQFSDMTNEEFLRYHTGYKTPIDSSLTTSSEDQSFIYQSLSTDVIPASLDWREQGAVTFVKNQGSCNGCWAFAAAAAVEGITKIKTGQLVNFSVQQLLECDPSNDGCQGGDISSAFNYIQTHGIASASASASVSVEKYGQPTGISSNQTCDTQKETHAAHITRYERVPYANQSALLKAVSMQPVAVAIDSSGFKSYNAGVYSGPCDGSQNHAVTIIGYGTESGTSYWLIKNSWGIRWGEKGYMKILRTQPSDGYTYLGDCNLAKYAWYPIV